MPFRFRRSIRIVPGIRLNVGRRGVSASVGGREGHVTVVGSAGTRAGPKLNGRQTHDVFTVGIWGAGLLGAAAMMALLFLWTVGWL